MTELCRSFFDGGSSPTANVIDETKLEDKVFMVLNWSMGLRNLGIHRPYGAYTLLRIWADQREIFLHPRSLSRAVQMARHVYRSEKATQRPSHRYHVWRIHTPRPVLILPLHADADRLRPNGTGETERAEKSSFGSVEGDADLCRGERSAAAAQNGFEWRLARAEMAG